MKMNHSLLVKAILLPCFIALGGCYSTPQEAATDPTGNPDLAKIRTEIQALETDFGKAITNHDLDALLEYYADDAISLAEGSPMLVGKAAIGEHYKNHVMNAKKIHTYQTIDVFAEGNMVVETGKSTVTDSSGNTHLGKYMALYQKRNGQYICIREAYNSDEPMR